MSNKTESLYSEAVQELVAIGAAIASNCEPCFKYHFGRAQKLGVSKEDVAKAVATAQMVKEKPASNILKLAERFLDRSLSPEIDTQKEGSEGKCCSSAPTARTEN